MPRTPPGNWCCQFPRSSAHSFRNRRTPPPCPTQANQSEECAAPADTTTALSAWNCARWRKTKRMPRQIAYAATTPNARAANEAQTTKNINMRRPPFPCVHAVSIVPSRIFSIRFQLSSKRLRKHSSARMVFSQRLSAWRQASLLPPKIPPAQCAASRPKIARLDRRTLTPESH